MQKIEVKRFKQAVGGDEGRVALVFEGADGDLGVVLSAEQAFETLMACLPAFSDAAFKGGAYRAQVMAAALQWVDDGSPGSRPVLRVYLGEHDRNRLEIGVPPRLLPALSQSTQQFVSELQRKGRIPTDRQ